MSCHIVWATKYHYDVLQGDIQHRCRDLLVQICNSENVHILKGVKYAVWQPETQQLALIFNSKKTSSQDVAKNIAAVGHEANGITATEAIYDSLPMCCQYKSVEPHVP